MESRGDGQRLHTSAGVRQLRPAEEAQVSSPSPDGLRVSEAEPGAEVVRLQRLITINSEVAAGVVATLDPDLQPTHHVRAFLLNKPNKKQIQQQQELFCNSLA